MSKCPNCGQNTGRTLDWACEWCGYPILLDSYETILKTYRKLKEERLYKRKLQATKESSPEAEPVPNTTSESTVKSEQEKTSIAAEVTVDELITTYEKDEAAADNKFAGKTVKLTGIVYEIESKDYLDFYYVILTNAEDSLFQRVRCFFDKKHKPELVNLTSGQEIKVQGVFDGSMINIRLRDCVLVG